MSYENIGFTTMAVTHDLLSGRPLVQNGKNDQNKYFLFYNASKCVGLTVMLQRHKNSLCSIILQGL